VKSQPHRKTLPVIKTQAGLAIDLALSHTACFRLTYLMAALIGQSLQASDSSLECWSIEASELSFCNPRAA